MFDSSEPALCDVSHTRGSHESTPQPTMTQVPLCWLYIYSLARARGRLDARQGYCRRARGGGLAGFPNALVGQMFNQVSKSLIFFFKPNTSCCCLYLLSHCLCRARDDAPLQHVLHPQEHQDEGRELLRERHRHRGTDRFDVRLWLLFQTLLLEVTEQDHSFLSQ